MTILPNAIDPVQNFLTIVRKPDFALWNIYMGDWYRTGKELMPDIEWKTKEEILVNAHDLVRFAQQIRKLLKLKLPEDTRLNLTFQSNIPDFRIKLRFVDRGHPFYFTEREGKFEFSAGINIYSSVVNYHGTDAEYLYEEDGEHVGLMQFYPYEILEKFASDLEKEATSVINA